MSEIHPAHADFHAHNETYASEFDPTHGEIRLAPKKKLIVGTSNAICLDTTQVFIASLDTSHLYGRAHQVGLYKPMLFQP